MKQKDEMNTTEKIIFYNSILLSTIGLIFYVLVLFEVISKENSICWFSMLIWTPGYVLIIKYICVIFKKERKEYQK